MLYKVESYQRFIFISQSNNIPYPDYRFETDETVTHFENCNPFHYQKFVQSCNPRNLRNL